jgi:hypothetical protein
MEPAAEKRSMGLYPCAATLDPLRTAGKGVLTKGVVGVVETQR